jgi:hypothetical protein
VTATCRRCDAPIIWAKTEKGRPVPLDVNPAPTGNLRLERRSGQLTAIYVTRPKPDGPPPPQRSLFEADADEQPAGPDQAQLDAAAAALYGPLHLSHFVTCPHAHEFRKRTPTAGGTGRRVRSERSPHACHARGCTTEVDPAMLMCKRHWSIVPKPLKNAVWGTYVAGQELRKDPTAEYLRAAQAAIDAVAEVER